MIIGKAVEIIEGKFQIKIKPYVHTKKFHIIFLMNSVKSET